MAEKAEVLQALLPALDRWADHHHTDLVLVTKDKPSYAAAQRTRQKSLGHRSTGDRTRSSLWRIGPEDAATERLHDIAETLAAAARAGHLTLFVGAGSSLASGLPGWRKLLANLAAKISQEPGLAERLEKLDLRDQASLLQRRFERYELTADGLGPAIAEELAGHQPSLVHQLLASLPVREMVTTNFDELLERAVAAVDGTTPAILPFDAATSSDRWILKLHGTVARVAHPCGYLRTSVTHRCSGSFKHCSSPAVRGLQLSDEDFHARHEIAVVGPMGTASRP